MNYKVAWGSVVGLMFFSLYFPPVGQIHSHGINFHYYADDSQLYVPVKLGDISEFIKL